MMLGVLLLWVLVIGAVVWLVVVAVRGRSPSGRLDGDEDPEAIVRKRYARGEIDRDTYEGMRDDLEGGGRGS